MPTSKRWTKLQLGCSRLNELGILVLENLLLPNAKLRLVPATAISVLSIKLRLLLDQIKMMPLNGALMLKILQIVKARLNYYQILTIALLVLEPG